MRNTSWSCDNHCDQPTVFAKGCPSGWYLLTQRTTEFVLCSKKCIVEFTHKMILNRPMGEKIEVKI